MVVDEGRDATDRDTNGGQLGRRRWMKRNMTKPVTAIATAAFPPDPGVGEEEGGFILSVQYLHILVWKGSAGLFV